MCCIPYQERRIMAHGRLFLATTSKEQSMPLPIIPDLLSTPTSCVRLQNGVMKTAFDNNIEFLKTVDMNAMLYWFRVNAGQPAPGQPYRGHFEDNIKGQTAGMFMMGAGNALRWAEDAELRDRLEEVVGCIDGCRESDGYLMAIPKQEFGTKEYPNYVRAWLTFGLIAAGQAGVTRAWEILADWQTWFNQCGELRILRYLTLGFQGISGTTAVMFSPVGTERDVEVAEDHYVEDWRMGQFITRDPNAVHIRNQPGHEPHAHGSEITAFEGWLDLYRATGNPVYLNAVLAAHEAYRRDWQHVGGGIVMIESEEMYPGCRWIAPGRTYNELCCSAYWIWLNHRLHRLFPDEDLYVSEIEKSLYNIILANQFDDRAIRYCARLEGTKDDCWRERPISCCSGTGTRVLGMLPEFVYSLSDSGISVNLHVASEIEWEHRGRPVKLTQKTDMPHDGHVRIDVESTPVRFGLRIRIPAWCDSPVAISVNGSVTAEGKPGTWVRMDCEWQPGDRVDFTLPLSIRSTRYEGGDQVLGNARYAFERGPVLMALRVKPDKDGRVLLPHDPERASEWLIPTDEPGHCRVEGFPSAEVVPYYEVGDEWFTCFPSFRP
jgi:uncharacterized protein